MLFGNIYKTHNQLTFFVINVSLLFFLSLSKLQNIKKKSFYTHTQTKSQIISTKPKSIPWKTQWKILAFEKNKNQRKTTNQNQ